jgi:hypothetical protein
MIRKHSYLSLALFLGLASGLQSCEGIISGDAGAVFEHEKKADERSRGSSPNTDDLIARAPLRVISYNTYHLPADRASLATSEQRLRFLPDALARTGADLIILQELRTPVAQDNLKSAMVQRGYQYFQSERRSAVPPFFLGNGLMIFAKKEFRPMGAVEFREWPETIGFDNYAVKGVLKVPLHIPNIGRVDVFNAHTSFLPWDGENKNYDMSESKTLMAQVDYLTQWVKSSPAAIKILGADMNFDPHVWDASRQGFDNGRKNEFYTKLSEVLSDPFAISQANCRFKCETWDNQNNKLLSRGLFGDSSNGSMYDPEPNARYDYVMFAGKNIKVAQIGTAMHDEFPVKYKFDTFPSPLSDHYGIVTDLLIPKVQ